MSLGITFRRKGDTIHLSGVIDEFVDLSPLAVEAEPIKLNLAGISAANSLGIRLWIGMIKGLKDLRVEFYDCPPVFLDVVNMAPAVVHHAGSTRRIKSVLIPYQCEVCKARHNVSVATHSVKVKGDAVIVANPACAKCGAEMENEHEPDDSFFFLTLQKDVSS